MDRLWPSDGRLEYIAGRECPHLTVVHFEAHTLHPDWDATRVVDVDMDVCTTLIGGNDARTRWLMVDGPQQDLHAWPLKGATGLGRRGPWPHRLSRWGWQAPVADARIGRAGFRVVDAARSRGQ